MRIIFKTHPNQNKEFLKTFTDSIKIKDKKLVKIVNSRSINDLIFYSEK